ncbi:MAG: glycosyltransferase family 4 protein [Anaerolineae bacterium]|nr:glycosyltransferase family 4 protein [Anaerolineae bacterium]
MTVNEIHRPKLTICAIGSSQSSHVVSRVKCFAERGHRVYLLCDSIAGIDGITEIVPVGPPHSILNSILYRVNKVTTRFLKKSTSPYTDPIHLFYNFRRVLKHCNPDIVHIHYAYNGWAWMAAAADYHPLVVSVMGGDVLFEEQGSPSPRGKWLTLQLFKRADLITSKSDYLITVLDKLGGFGSKAIKVVWGADLARFRRMDATALRTQLGLSANHRVILSPKILQPFYNVHLIVEAMPQIVAAHPEIRLLITEYAADPDYKKQIAAQVQQLGLSNHIIFVGHIQHHEMPLYYNLAEMTVAVPSSDGLPQTLLEGMGCEVPNILSRLPRYEEIVTHEQSAYFVDSSPPGIAEGVLRLLNDEELRHNIACNGLEIVRTQADFDKEVSRVEAKYYELLARRRKHRNWFDRLKILREILYYYAHP